MKAFSHYTQGRVCHRQATPAGSRRSCALWLGFFGGTAGPQEAWAAGRAVDVPIGLQWAVNQAIQAGVSGPFFF